VFFDGDCISLFSFFESIFDRIRKEVGAEAKDILVRMELGRRAGANREI
jgi:hypothetical protein